MTEDTKFPETIMDSLYNDKEMTDKVPNPYKEWLKRCMEDYPTPFPKDITVVESNLSQIIAMNNWFVTWFSQFKETEK